MEGCIAVIANSMTAYRALFAASSSQIGDSPRHEERSSALRNRYPKRIPGGDLPTMPAPTFTGFKSMIQKDPFADDGEMMDSERMLKGGSGIQVTHSFRTHSSSGDPSERTGRVGSFFLLVIEKADVFDRTGMRCRNLRRKISYDTSSRDI